MNGLKMTAAFTARNIKLFFKDKGALISALIAPLIILLLYILFLDSVLVSTFKSSLPEGFELSEKLIKGYVASFEVSSILAVSCVTVAFVANMTMVDDKITGVRADLTVAPVNSNVIVLGYYFATAIITFAVCSVAMLCGFAYIAASGWEMATSDVLAIVLDVVLATMFGTALSSVVCYFLSSRGAINAVATTMSSVYGFICGAYYPISQFSGGIADFVMCLPGTYGTLLFRTHFMGCYASAFADAGVPSDVVDMIIRSLDAKASFFGTDVKVWAMYTVMCVSILALVGIFVLFNVLSKKLRKKPKAKTEQKA